MRRHGGGGDAARMRARGIAQRVGGGWFQFILWVLPTRSSLSNPVGQSVRCSPCSVSLFFFSSAASFPLSFLYSHPSPALARPSHSYTVSPSFFSLCLFFPPISFFSSLYPSSSIATVYVYNITHSYAPREQQRRYNIKKKKKKTRDFLMDPLLYFSITSQARFFPGAIRPPRADAPPFTCSTCQLTERAAPSAGN